ncbi:MAG: hypothetical protein ACKV19_02115 [Verrucomicrobiales bacterium]
MIHPTLDGIIARYSKHPALLGYVVCDEPGTELFPRLGVVNQYLQTKDPQQFPYINLLPAYAFNTRPICEEHFLKCLETVKPAFLSCVR